MPQMPTCIPYQNLHLLGTVLDWTAPDLRSKNNEPQTTIQYDLTENTQPQVQIKCRVIENIQDVCELLDIRPELVLKVEIGQVKNDVIAEVVKDICDENVLTVVFQATICVATEKAARNMKDNVKVISSAMSTEQISPPSIAALVTTKEIGNELIAILKVKCQDTTMFKEMFKNSLNTDSQNSLDAKTLKGIEMCTKFLDRKCQESNDLCMSLEYYGFLSTLECPETASGIVDMLRNFRECQRLARPYIKSEKRMGKIEINQHCKELQEKLIDIDEPSEWYELRLHLDDSNIPQNDSYGQCQDLLRTRINIQNSMRTVDQINDEKWSVSDYTVDPSGKRKMKLMKSVEKIDECIHNMKIGDVLDDAIERLCRKDFLEDCLKLPTGDDIDLVLLGNTGSGKSSVGNGILNLPMFEVSTGVQQCTKVIDSQACEVDQRTIRVCDTPDIYEQSFGDHDQEGEIISFLTEVMEIYPNGFNAFIFVFSYRGRSTIDDMRRFEMLQTALGREVIKSHGICVITGGDQMAKDTNCNFQSFCHMHDLTPIMEQFQFRCVLFDNETNDRGKQKSQLLRLVWMIDGIGAPYKFYLNKFESEARQRFLEQMSFSDVKNFLLKLMEQLTNSKALSETQIKKLNVYLEEAQVRFTNKEEVQIVSRKTNIVKKAHKCMVWYETNSNIISFVINRYMKYVLRNELIHLYMLPEDGVRNNNITTCCVGSCFAIFSGLVILTLVVYKFMINK